MGPADRRTVLRGLAAPVAFGFAGCRGRASRSGSRRPVESEPIRTIDPVRTEGDPVHRSHPERTSPDYEETLGTVVSNRSDCLDGAVPVGSFGSGVLITTRTVVTSLDHADVLFPSRSYDHLKAVAPRSIVVSGAGETSTSPEEMPVFIRAILEDGDSERIVPPLAGTCPSPGGADGRDA